MPLWTSLLPQLLLPLLFTASFGQAVPEFNPATLDLPPSLSVETPSQKGIHAVQNLIDRTEENLEQQKKLVQLLSDYQAVESRYIENPNNESYVVELIQKARGILTIVEDQHLSHLLDEGFLSEIALFGRVGEKQSAAL